MKKLIVTAGAIAVAAGAIAVAALVAKRWASSGGLDFGRMIERMPEDAPPKWMFRNITAIRENTERILELVENEREVASPGG